MRAAHCARCDTDTCQAVHHSQQSSGLARGTFRNFPEQESGDLWRAAAGHLRHPRALCGDVHHPCSHTPRVQPGFGFTVLMSLFFSCGTGWELHFLNFARSDLPAHYDKAVPPKNQDTGFWLCHHSARECSRHFTLEAHRQPLGGCRRC